LERLLNHFALFLFIGLACYAGLFFWGEGAKVWDSLRSFPLGRLPLLLILASLNYVLRYVRWQMYLRSLDIFIGSWKSFQIFMAGLSMTVTPGKMGEALKAQFLKDATTRPWSKGIPVVFAERLTDLMGVVVLTALGVSVLPVGGLAALLGMGICIFLVAIVVRPKLYNGAVGLLGKLPRMSEAAARLLEMRANASRLMTLRLSLTALIISCLAWFSECMALYVAVAPIQAGISGLRATFIYALSTLAGALSMLPGGLLISEGSMAGMLVLFGLDRSEAVSVTVIVRLCTLWFAVFLGMIFLLVIQRNERKRISPSG